MIIASHQPHFLPWLGYLHKIAHCDRFVVLDHVQYEKQNFQNRNRLKLRQGVEWLTVPVANHGFDESISDKRISPVERDWHERAWRVLEQNYQKAPYFTRYAPTLRAILSRRHERLLELNLDLLEAILGWFDIQTPLVLSSTLGLTSKKGELVLDIVQALEGDVALLGSGGSRQYIDESRFDAAGIHIQWQQFSHPVYPQLHPEQGFAPRMSSLDLLFNCGPASRDILLGTAPRPLDVSPPVLHDATPRVAQVR